MGADVAGDKGAGGDVVVGAGDGCAVFTDTSPDEYKSESAAKAALLTIKQKRTVPAQSSLLLMDNLYGGVLFMLQDCQSDAASTSHIFSKNLNF
jgi:hypothetical protein